CRFCFFFQAEDGIRDLTVTGVQTCALPICMRPPSCWPRSRPSSGSCGPPVIGLLPSPCRRPTRARCWLRFAPKRLSCGASTTPRSEEHTSELQSQSNLVCRLLLEKKKNKKA